MVVEGVAPIGGHTYDVFDTGAPPLGVKPGFDGKNHALAQHQIVSGDDEGLFVGAQPDTVPGAVGEVLPQAGFGEYLSGRSVYLRCRDAGAHYGPSCGLRAFKHLVGREKFRIHSAINSAINAAIASDIVGAGAIGVVAAGNGAPDVDDYRVACLQHAVREAVVGVTAVGSASNDDEVHAVVLGQDELF